MDITYRVAKQGDLEEIELLIKAAIIHMKEQKILQWDDKYPTKEDFNKDIQKKELYVGVKEGKIAVVYALNQEYDKDYRNGQWEENINPYFVLHRLCVNPFYQNQGVAKATLKNIENQVFQLGAKAIRLDAFLQNPYAIKLYESFGFHIVGKVTWRMGEFCLMEKVL